MITETKRYSSDKERTLLTALIVHNEVLSRVASHIEGIKNPFRSRYSNLVAGWCLEHFKKYGKAPRANIQGYYAQFAQESTESETLELIDDLLSGLDRDYKARAQDMNEGYLVDMASVYFREVKLERLFEEGQRLLERGDSEEAQNLVKSFDPPAFASNDCADLFSAEIQGHAFRETENREIVHFPGDLGKFTSPHFERDGFISFVGPEKKGKSYWLMETVWQALKQRRRVLYYITGDMSLDQVARRFGVRAARRPFRAMDLEYPVSIQKPSKGETTAQVETKIKHYTNGVTSSQTVTSLQSMLKTTGAKESRLKTFCYGGSEITASRIEADVREFSRQGWPPDCVVIDYADLLAPEPSTKNMEFRHQVNETWKVLRRIAQNHHLLMVTATQAAATSYDSKLIRKKDFSEDKRKNAHVTGMLGINQTSEEKAQGIYRLNWVFLRDGAWTDTQVVWTAGCLAVSCPCVVSVL